jgi:hypothetical protein
MGDLGYKLAKEGVHVLEALHVIDKVVKSRRIR